MTSKKSRDTSKSKHSSKDDYREDKHRGTSKDYEQEVPSTRHKDKSDSHKSKSKHSSKTNDYDQDAVALPDEEEERERRRRKKLRKQLEEEERLKREEDERLKREQEEYEEERRRRKEKNRDTENGDSRKHKSSRVKSPRSPSPPPAPSKHKSKATEKDDNYSDDFEQNYDDDFDDEPAPPPVKKSSSSYKEEKYNSTYDESPKTKSYSSSTTTGVNEVQVYANTRRFHSHDISDRIRRRYQDLSRLITLDRQSFNILDMAPMPAHAAYMRDIRLNNTKNQSTDNTDGGTGWTANIKVQTNDDAEHVQSQTDEVDTRSMWTQHPSENQNKSCGSGNTNDENQFSDINKTRENEELLRMLRLETDLGRYQTFVTNAGKLMLALLDEQQTTSTKSNSKRSKDNDEQDGMQRESDLNFSSGVTILPGLSFKSDISIAAVCFCQDKPEQVAVFYEQIYTTSYGAIYNVRNPDKPLKLLNCEASVRCCSSSMVYLFAGCHDGSIVLFDTSEPTKYKTDSQEPIPSSPTFSTANIQFNERHYSEVIRVLPLQTTNVTNNNDRSSSSFSLASLDKNGLIIIWSVIELTQSDEAGSIADLGLKPGGRVRMIQTSSMQIKQSIYMAKDSIQAFDLSCPINDVDNLYVASNANAVYHMTRYGEMGSPSKLRVSTDLEAQIEVTCLSFNPMVNKLLLVGTGHGQLHLYTTGRDEPILTWSQAFRSSAIVRSCNWSTGRASIFFAHDSQGHIKYWDLTKDLYQPLGNVKIENLSHFILSISSQAETAFALVTKQNSSQIEIHQLKRTFTTHSDSFSDNFKTILKDIMTNT
ncbi:unnamed protein product [Adineta steineri]|uniref:WD repeat-containing protein 60 n=1 Tax=Adineta steineri TaxID=433720 RepID=A0A814RJK6_9BILA|nr:unnamed protein product [Adineta steineri]